MTSPGINTVNGIGKSLTHLLLFDVAAIECSIEMQQILEERLRYK